MKKLLFPLFLFFSLSIPIILTIYNVFSGGMAFWYDPARDMLSAWDNLNKVTLIGSTSGIPGIFYGPYWIWWLSFAEIFSKDPRVVLFVTTALPYLIIFPFILYKFSKIFDKFTSVLLWLLFYFAFNGYMTALWNPNLAPLLYLCIIYILINSFEKGRKNIYLIIAGILTGIAFNIHISFTSGFFIGTLFFIILNPLNFPIKENFVKIVKSFLSFILGFSAVFWPFVLFEMRHNFEQTKAFINAITKAGDVVGVHGLSKQSIMSSFFESFAKILSLPSIFGIVALVLLTCLIIFLCFRKSVNFSSLQKQLLFIISTITISVLGIYLFAKNPIWGYHFVGIEIVFLLFLGIILTKIPVFRFVALVLIVCSAFVQISSTIKGIFLDPLRIDSLNTKEYVVRQITKDAKEPYTVFAYNPAVYMYDYSYLFRWLSKKDFSYDPGMIKSKGTIYLILPGNSKSAIDDFTHFKTPDSFYKTTRSWQILDGTIILKRSQIKT